MSFLTGGGGGSAPQPPPFVAAPIYGPNGAINLASQYGNLGYQLADQAFAQQYPGLVNLRNTEIASSGAQSAATKLDPSAQNAITNSAESNTLAAFGGSQGTPGTAGSAVRGTTAANIASSTQAIEDYNRTSNLSLVAQNPQRLTDLTGAQLVQIMLGNILGQNQNTYQAYAANTTNSSAQNAAGLQQFLASLQAAGSIAATAASDARFKENIRYVGRSPSGIPMVEFNYTWSKKRYRGVLAQDVIHAAIQVFDRLFVDYSKLDVRLEAA